MVYVFYTSPVRQAAREGLQQPRLGHHSNRAVIRQVPSRSGSAVTLDAPESLKSLTTRSTSDSGTWSMTSSRPRNGKKPKARRLRSIILSPRRQRQTRSHPRANIRFSCVDQPGDAASNPQLPHGCSDTRSVCTIDFATGFPEIMQLLAGRIEIQSARCRCFKAPTSQSQLTQCRQEFGQRRGQRDHGIQGDQRPSNAPDELCYSFDQRGAFSAGISASQVTPRLARRCGASPVSASGRRRAAAPRRSAGGSAP